MKFGFKRGGGSLYRKVCFYVSSLPVSFFSNSYFLEFISLSGFPYFLVIKDQSPNKGCSVLCFETGIFCCEEWLKFYQIWTKHVGGLKIVPTSSSIYIFQKELSTLKNFGICLQQQTFHNIPTMFTCPKKYLFLYNKYNFVFSKKLILPFQRISF